MCARAPELERKHEGNYRGREKIKWRKEVRCVRASATPVTSKMSGKWQVKRVGTDKPKNAMTKQLHTTTKTIEKYRTEKG